MLNVNPAAAIRTAALFVLVIFASGPAEAVARESNLHFQRNDQGLIAPFTVKQLPLADFARAYSQFTGVPVDAAGPLEREVTGTVTLFVRHPIRDEALTELFHQALDENQYAVVDAPAHGGWLIERTRDARDAAVPVYTSDASEYEKTYRMVTVIHSLKRLSGEEISRVMRNFMPPNTRIISPTRSQLILTAPGRTIAGLIKLINAFEALGPSPVAHHFGLDGPPPPACPADAEHHIEKIVVDRLEVGNMSELGQGPGPASRPNPESKTHESRHERSTR